MSQTIRITRAIQHLGLLTTLAIASLLNVCVTLAIAQERPSEVPACRINVLQSLPPLHAIDAETNLAAFLEDGVTPQMTIAALRRAWTADTPIRDFKGLAEMDWDLSNGDGVFGFSELGPEVDVRQMLAGLFSGPGPKPMHVAQRSYGLTSLLVSLGYARKAIQ